MKFKGIKYSGYQKLAAFVNSMKEADRAPLPTDPEGMTQAADAYAKQMEQLGLPIHDFFWDKYKEFTYWMQLEDIEYAKNVLSSMSKRVQDIMQDPEFYINSPAPQSDMPQKESPDVFTSVKPWSVSGLTFEKMQSGVDQAVSQWEQEVASREQNPYSIFWDDLAAFNEAVSFEDYDNAKVLYDKIVNFKDNYTEALEVPQAEPSEAEQFDFTKMMGSKKKAVPLKRKGPAKRRDKTLQLLEDILGKPVKSLYDEEGDVSDMGEAWYEQEPDFGGKGLGKGLEDQVFEVEVEDEPEEEEFVPEKKEVDPFEL